MLFTKFAKRLFLSGNSYVSMILRKQILLFALLSFTAMLYSQKENQRDTTLMHKPEGARIIGPQSKDSVAVSPSNNQIVNKNQYRQLNDQSNAISGEQTYKMGGVDYFPEKLLEERSTSHYPLSNDHSYSGIKMLDATSWISGSTEHTTLPSFAQIQQTALQYNRIFGNRLLLSGGLSGQKMEIHERQYGDLKANLGATWMISDRVSVEAAGDYSLIRADGGTGSLMGALIPSEVSGGRTAFLTPLAEARLGANYKVTSWLDIYGGTYVNDNRILGQGVTDYGLNSRMDLRLNDRLNIKLYGTYSLKGKQALVNQNSIYSENNYGGAIEYRISDKFGMGMGVDRQLNPFTGKWVTRPFVYPIFYNDNGEKKNFQIKITSDRQ